MSEIEVLDELGPLPPEDGANASAADHEPGADREQAQDDTTQAETVSGIDPSTLPATLAGGGALPPTAEEPKLASRGRFRLTLALLAGVGVAAVAIAIAVAANGNTHNGVPNTNWSSWKPSSSGSEGVNEIAQHVEAYYRLNQGKTLDVVTPLAVTSTDSSGVTTGSGLTVAVDPGSKSSSSSATQTQLELLGGKTVAYNVCGLGAKDCTLGGKPSAERLLLLRREALELALYTFTYVSGTDNVLVVLPPGKTEHGKGKSASKPVTVTVLFVKQAMQQFLDQPLSRTLALYPPDVSELKLWSQTAEANMVDQVTSRYLFSEQVESQQEGGRLLVLSPLPTQ